MSGISRPVKRNFPCPICGKTDWCNIISYPSGDEVYACHRAEGSKGDTATGADGRIYRCTGETSGGFTKWQELSQYEAFIEKLKAEGKGKKGSYSKSSGNPTMKVAYSPKYEDIPVKGVAKLASPERIDLVNRTFLSLLILEQKHEAKLKMEWDRLVDDVNIYDLITKTWPILSIPPEDFIRFSSLERLNSLSRKKIMEKLIELVGEPLGVPGFYQRKDGAWTFYRLSGIVFPAFNSRGQIIRLRVNDDYPLIDAELDGRAGVFHYQKDVTDNVVGWYFIPQDGEKLNYSKAELVWSFGSPQNRVTLDLKGYPKGKVRGKYKNFSSYTEKLVEENGKKYRLNTLTNGCQSGSSTSLYTKPGDDMDLVYITEGEKKAIVANAILNAPVISLPGVASYEKVFENEEGYDTSLMDELKKKGMELAVLIFDADKNENEKVMNSEKKAVAEFLKRDIPIAIGEWNENWGKGLDDVLLTGVKPKITVIS